METKLATVEELVQAALEKKPVDAQELFDQLIKDRVAERVSLMKDAVRDTMFNGGDGEDDDEEETEGMEVGEEGLGVDEEEPFDSDSNEVQSDTVEDN